MDSTFSTLLCKITPSGEEGFEGLISKCLENLTGLSFRLSKSGYQGGRDLSSNEFGANRIAVECKRYKHTKLNERELLGEIVQAKREILDLDLWILVTSSSVDSRLFESLKTASEEQGLFFYEISDSSIKDSELKSLLAHHSKLTISYLKSVGSKEEISLVRKELSQFKKEPRYTENLRKLIDVFCSPLVGYASFKAKNNLRLIEQLKSAGESRVQFGQYLNVLDDQESIIDRSNLQEKLSSWYENWSQKKEFFALLGEEGNGKTWGLAAWVGQLLQQEISHPVLWASSKDLKSGRALDVITQIANRIQPKEWERRIERWISSKESKLPLFLLIIDGINENRLVKWRELIEELALSSECRQKIAVIFTCRTMHWDRYYQDINNCSRYELGSFSDSEFSYALEQYNLKKRDFPKDLLPLASKPRYLSIIVRNLSKIAESGEYTIARLICEDWKDRYSRKSNHPLDDQEFQSLIRDLATRRKLSLKEVDQNISNQPNKENALEELATSGIFNETRGKWKVKEEFVAYGLALILLDALEESEQQSNSSISEIIGHWIEPQAGINLKSKILNFACFLAMQESFEEFIQVELLLFWSKMQNPENGMLQDFASYFPINPCAYFRLAELVWSESQNSPFIQELIMQTILKWRRNSHTLDALHAVLDRWLGLIGINGVLGLNTSQPKRDLAKQEINERLGFELQPKELLFHGYRFTVVEDYALLRLGRVALGLISYLELSDYIHSITKLCIAEFIMGSVSKYDLVQWLFISVSSNITPLVLKEVDFLLNSDNVLLHKTAYWLLIFDGSNESHCKQDLLPLEAFPKFSKKSFKSDQQCDLSLNWSQDECIFCAERDEISVHHIADKLRPFCANPELQLSPSFTSKLSRSKRSTSWGQNDFAELREMSFNRL